MAQWFFAYAGGTIPDPLLLTVNGDTHGGKVETLSTTADTTAGEVLLDNFSATNLTEGAIYGVSGPGILDGSLLVYTAASGDDEATYKLTAAPTETGGSVTLTLTKSITVAETFGDISGGTISSIADTAALVPGVTYGVTGSGIPPGTLVYWTGGTTATLTTISGGAVSAASGSVALTFTGMPNAASGLITNVSGISGLEVGSVYNVSGPGIPKGSTFTADGTDQISLDGVATASHLGASLVIDGPRVQTEPFDASKHAVEDAKIRSVKVSQKEGGFAELEITLQNPGTGLLAPGRQEWCWLSYDAGDGEILPVFNGRIVGAFADFHKEIVQLSFVAQPDNYAAKKREIYDSLAGLPYSDPVWYSNGTPDADTILETISALWHIDRTTLEVTTSDILVGEDGIIEIGEEDHRYDTMEVTIAQPPITRVHVTGTVSWTQQGSGTIDITSQTNKLFQDATSMYGGTLGFESVISTLTDGLEADWPKAGTSIGGGWSVGLDTSIEAASWVKQYNTSTSFDSADVGYFDEDLAEWQVTFPIYSYKLNLTCDWDASRKRTETVEFTMLADLQRLMSQPAGADEESITLTSNDIGDAVDIDYTPPVGDLRRNSYFNTTRGISSVEYLMLLARAKIRARARAIEIAFECRLEDALGISLRHNVHLTDRRLPGGEATGKVIGYEICQDQSGRPYAKVTIGCSIGRDGIVTAAEGTGAWVDAGAVSAGIQTTVGGETTLVTSELVYQPLTDFKVSDDGLNLFDLKSADAINSFTMTNGLKDQIAAVQAALDPMAEFDTVPTRICLDLKPVQGVDFHTDYLPAVKPLPVPKTIDLEAA